MVEAQQQQNNASSDKKSEWADQSWNNTTGSPPDTARKLGNKTDRDNSIPPNVATSYDQTTSSQQQQSK
jgi:hypothetical protein